MGVRIEVTAPLKRSLMHPTRVSVICVSLRIDLPGLRGSVGPPPPRVSVILIHVSLRLHLPDSAAEGNPGVLSALYMA